MIFYILLNHITTLFVSIGLLTTLTFDSEVTSYMYGGAKEDIFIKVTNNMKTIAIKPKREKLSSNLLVITKNRKYYFNVHYSKNDPHQFVEVKDGQINFGMKSIVSNNKYEILEGDSSILIINKGNIPLIVNDKLIKHKEYFSKGIPLLIDNKRILN